MLQVKSVDISRFRGIREGAVQDFADVNLLIGRNNAGKSTVVEAIHRAADANVPNAADPLGRRIEVWAQTRLENAALPLELWYNLDQTHSISLNIAVAAPPVKVNADAGVKFFYDGGPRGLSDFKLSEGPRLRRDEVVEFLSRATVFRPADARNSDIENRLWPKIIGPRHDKGLTQTLNTVFGQNAESYAVVNAKLMLLFPDHAVPLDSQGEGNRAALRCLMLMTVLRKTFFIAEEIECHQHPGSLARFAEALCRAAREREIQLFLTTHSADRVRAFLGATREAGSEAVVFHLKLNDGVLDATRLAPDAAQALLDTGVDVRFLDLYG